MQSLRRFEVKEKEGQKQMADFRAEVLRSCSPPTHPPSLPHSLHPSITTVTPFHAEERDACFIPAQVKEWYRNSTGEFVMSSSKVLGKCHILKVSPLFLPASRQSTDG